MKDILSEIVAHKREEINALKERMPVDKIYVNACYHPTASLRNALETSSHGIIAEFKRRSPSKGWIKRKAKPSDIIPGYRKSGAAALSVLTDEKYFGGTLDDVLAARPLADIPILRKDFTVDEYQLHQACAAGADAVLLIAATLGVNECRHLAAVAHELKLETVLEVHSENELEYVNDNIDIIGVNNRNLGTFITNTANSEYLAPKLPVSITRISESGIKDAQTILRLQLLGFKGFLIGESFMQADNPAQELARLVADIWELYQNLRV